MGFEFGAVYRATEQTEAWGVIRVALVADVVGPVRLQR